MAKNPRDVVVVSAVRTAVTKAKKGALKDTRPDDLMIIAIQGALERVPGFDPALIDDVIVSAWAAGLYVFLYALVVGFAMVRNALRAPYSWLFRPRFVVFAFIAVDVYLWAGCLE